MPEQCIYPGRPPAEVEKQFHGIARPALFQKTVEKFESCPAVENAIFLELGKGIFDRRPGSCAPLDFRSADHHEDR